ncbi:MAG: Gfo/Idh/MocA family oxidoreductase [Candidatus Thermoplasmatota archaeon]|nr:Gfo/Idh/MocA family oxidoreductase [Candidatus Thermoplasmatota archaeon]MCL5785429.1 Gfo/Idh/MocA family oxidoreductase [Candidatus Thermoplasmatota archaeon]
MKFGIVGLGNHSVNRIIPAIGKSGNEVASVFSRNGEKADRVASSCGAQAFTSMDDFLNSAFDAAYIASPNFLHFPHALACLEAGKDVLLEKPMTLKNEDAETLVSKSESSGRKLAVGFHMRFHPAIWKIKSYLDESEIGEISKISGTWGGLSSRSDTPDTKWWYTPEEAGGGSVMGTGVHVIDSILYLTGKTPNSVTAKRYPGGEVIEQTEEIVMDFSSFAAHVTSSRRMMMPDNSLYIYGTEGTIEGQSIFSTEIRGKLVLNGKQVSDFKGGSQYVSEISAFVDYAEGRSSRIATGQDGFEVVKVVNAAILSDREGTEAMV